MLSLLLLLSSAVEVVGTTSCPTADQVADQLAAILPAPESAVPRDRAHFQEIGDRVYVRLETPDGATLAERTFARGDDCAALALAIAVAVAAWESDLHPPLSPEEATPEGREPPATPAGAVTAASSDSFAAHQPAEPPAISHPRERTVRPEFLWGFAGGLTGDHPSGGVVLGAGIETATANGPAWGARAVGLLPLPLRGQLGPTAVSWWRPLVLAELSTSFLVARRARFELHPGLGVSLLRVSDGRQQTVSAEFVGVLGTRVGLWPENRLSAWIGLDGLLWPTPQILQHRESAERLKIPDWQVLLSVGLATSPARQP